MKKLISRAVFGACTMLPLASIADPTVLTFEGVGDEAAVDDFYNGGTDSAGHSGTNFGIAFSSTSLGLIAESAGGTGEFANEPSPSTILFFLDGGAATMNVAAGFATGFSFFYSAHADGFVNVYSGLNATGTLLATLALPTNYHDDQCLDEKKGNFCHFDPIGVTFDGTARSVDFGGSANAIGFDNVTIGSAEAGGGSTSVPEPESLLLVGLGMTALAAARRRR